MSCILTRIDRAFYAQYTRSVFTDILRSKTSFLSLLCPMFIQNNNSMGRFFFCRFSVFFHAQVPTPTNLVFAVFLLPFVGKTSFTNSTIE